LQNKPKKTRSKPVWIKGGAPRKVAPSPPILPERIIVDPETQAEVGHAEYEPQEPSSSMGRPPKGTPPKKKKALNIGDYGEIYALKDTQKNFVYDFSHPFVAMGGGWANGKTYALCRKVILLADLIPGIKIMMLQVTERQIKISLLPEFVHALMGNFATSDDLNSDPRVKRWSKGDLILEFVNGSRVDFMAFGEASHGVAQANKMLSATYGAIAADQADQMNEETFFSLRGRNRQKLVDAKGNPLWNFFMITYNPEAYSHWIYQTYVKKSPEKIGTIGHLYKTYEYSSRVGDLMDEHKLQEWESMDEHIRKRYVDGVWGAFGDMLYKEFDPDIHVIPGFRVPNNWDFHLVFDYGFTHESCFHLYAVSRRCDETPTIPEGFAFLIWEHYQSQWTTREHLNMVRPQLIGRRMGDNWCDPAIWNVRSDGKSIGDDYLEGGIHFHPADNSQLRGVVATLEMLQARPDRYNEATGLLVQMYGDGQFIPDKIKELQRAPKLFIFANIAPHAVEEIPSVRVSEQRYMGGGGTYLANIKKDHAADCVRYFCNQLTVEQNPEISEAMQSPHWKIILARKRKNVGWRVA